MGRNADCRVETTRRDRAVAFASVSPLFFFHREAEAQATRRTRSFEPGGRTAVTTARLGDSAEPEAVELEGQVSNMCLQ
eukprot:scaffold92676_cov30-Tisochrysis_lutea.AAC.2